MIAAFEVDAYLLIVHDLILFARRNPVIHKRPRLGVVNASRFQIR
jgi:hypothetical protein